MSDESQALTAQESKSEHWELALSRDPQLVLQEAQRAAAALGDVLAKKKKPVTINGEQYLEFEDLQTVAQFYGYAVRTFDATPCEIDGVKGAQAKAEVINMKSGIVIGGAEAYCMRDEPNWQVKPWYQISSMAQTRAAAKALRNRMSWVVVLAGYKGTPAEEVPHFESQPHDEPSDSNHISIPQRKRFYAIAKGAGKTDEQIKEYLRNRVGSDRTEAITRDVYDEVCQWAGNKIVN